MALDRWLQTILVPQGLKTQCSITTSTRFTFSNTIVSRFIVIFVGVSISPRFHSAILIRIIRDRVPSSFPTIRRPRKGIADSLDYIQSIVRSFIRSRTINHSVSSTPYVSYSKSYKKSKRSSTNAPSAKKERTLLAINGWSGDYGGAETSHL